MNTEALQAVKAKILEEPKDFLMELFHCGSAHCIAGWLEVMEFVPDATDIEIEKRLGMPDDSLFHLESWPDDLRYCYDAARGQGAHTDIARAAIAAEAIDRYIETEGRW